MLLRNPEGRDLNEIRLNPAPFIDASFTTSQKQTLLFVHPEVRVPFLMPGKKKQVNFLVKAAAFMIVLLCLTTCRAFLPPEERRAYEAYYSGNFVASSDDAGSGGRYFSPDGSLKQFYATHDGSFVMVGFGRWWVATEFNHATLWLDAEYRSIPSLPYLTQQHTFRLKRRDDGRVEAYENPLPFSRSPSLLLRAGPVKGFPMEAQYNSTMRKLGL